MWPPPDRFNHFEGAANKQPKARRGHSRDKRTDCPLLTLARVLDASGFVRRSRVFAGDDRIDLSAFDLSGFAALDITRKPGDFNNHLLDLTGHGGGTVEITTTFPIELDDGDFIF